MKLCWHRWVKTTILFPPPPHDGWVKAVCKKCQKVKRYHGQIKPYEASPEESAALGKLAEVLNLKEIK